MLHCSELVRGAAFKGNTIPTKARDLSVQFAGLLNGQNPSAVETTEDPYIYDIFVSALSLKAEMILSTTTNDLVFFSAGTPFDQRFMEIHDITKNSKYKRSLKQSVKVIAACCFPLVLEVNWEGIGEEDISNNEDGDWGKALVRTHMGCRVANGVEDRNGLVARKALVVCKHL